MGELSQGTVHKEILQQQEVRPNPLRRQSACRMYTTDPRLEDALLPKVIIQNTHTHKPIYIYERVKPYV